MNERPGYDDLTGWGTFLGELGNVHICPASQDGYTNHDISKDCPCHPRHEFDEHGNIWEHNPAS